MLRWHPAGGRRPARADDQLLLPARRAPGERAHRRRVGEVAHGHRPRQRRRVRPLRLDVLRAQRLRPVLPGLLGHLAVAHRRHGHDVRDRRRRLEGDPLAPRGRLAALVPRRHRAALGDGDGDVETTGGARAGAAARLPHVPPARGERRRHGRHAARGAGARQGPRARGRAGGRARARGIEVRRAGSAFSAAGAAPTRTTPWPRAASTRAPT
jgi:hypothetical protein